MIYKSHTFNLVTIEHRSEKFYIFMKKKWQQHSSRQFEGYHKRLEEEVVLKKQLEECFPTNWQLVNSMIGYKMGLLEGLRFYQSAKMYVLLGKSL